MVYGRNSKTSLLDCLLNYFTNESLVHFVQVICSKMVNHRQTKTALCLSVLNGSSSFKDFRCRSNTDGITGNCV